MDLQLKGKNAIVTGGGGGVGSAICELLAAEGANVVVSDIDLARAEAVAALCRASGVKAAAMRTDLAKSEECAALIDRTEELFGSAQECGDVAAPPRVRERESRRLRPRRDELLDLGRADAAAGRPGRELVDLRRKLVQVVADQLDQETACIRVRRRST